MMRSRATVLLLLLLGMLAALSAPFVSAGGYKRGHGKTHEEKQAAINTSAIYTGATARPATVRPISELPSHFDWCDVDGKSFCTASWNQHIPKYCGSCSNDRIKVLMDGKHDVMLARQALLNCGQSKGLGAGCDGGESFDVFEYMHRYGLPDESCANYVAESSAVCDQQAICSNCMPIGEEIFPYRCWAVPSPILYYVHEYGQVHGEAAMMSEIYARGPITCGFASVDDFDYAYRGGIYVDNTNATEMNHDVEVVGWGEENGIKYWRARNSWGTYWGENGFFRIQRGVNNMQFESDCVFALFDTHHLLDVLRGKMGGSMFGIVEQKDKVLNLTKAGNPHIQHSHNPNREAEQEGRRAEKLEREQEAEEEENEAGSRESGSGFSHSHGHNHGHKPRRGKAHESEEQVSSGHFGGEPTHRQTNERLHALDASELLHTYSAAYNQQQQSQPHTVDEGQSEVDGNTLDRESGQDIHEQQQGRERPHAAKHGSSVSSRQAGGSRGTAAQPSYQRDSSYAVERSDDSAERQAEADIMDAIRAAYQREQTRGRTQSDADGDGDKDNDIDRDDRDGRTKDRSDIAAAIHRALRSLGGDRDSVKAAVLRCLQRLEDEEADEVKAAEATGADVEAVREEKDRDVRIVEEETGRMWRQESANQTTDDVTDSIAKFIDGLRERGKKVVRSFSNSEPNNNAELAGVSDVDVDMSSVDTAGTAGQYVAWGVLLGVGCCVAGVYLLMKYKERNDYLEL